MNIKKRVELLQSYADNQLSETGIALLESNINLESSNGDKETQDILAEINRHKKVSSQLSNIHGEFFIDENKFVANTMRLIQHKTLQQKASSYRALTLGFSIAASLALTVGLIAFLNTNTKPNETEIAHIKISSIKVNSPQWISERLRSTDYTKNKVSRYLLADPPGSNL
jgi:hypothetical protein